MRPSHTHYHNKAESVICILYKAFRAAIIHGKTVAIIHGKSVAMLVKWSMVKNDASIVA